jgi:multidrug resistance efflux pump
MLAIAGVVALGLAAGGFFAYRRSPVSLAPPRVVPVAPSEITLTGIVQPAQVMNVSVPVDGTIDQFMAAVGQHVSEGEILARIRNAKRAAAQQIAKLDVEQAQSRLSQLESTLIAARLEVSRSEADAIRIKSNLAQTEKAFDRQKTMFQEGVTPRLAYEKAEHEYNSLKAAAESLAEIAKNAADRVDLTTKELEPARQELAQKNADLEDAEAEAAVGEVNSPADGVVIERRGQLGQPVTIAMTDLFQIAVDPLVLEAVAPVEPQARILAGQAVAIQIASAPSPTAGIVREVKSGQVFIDIQNPSPAIRRGVTVQIKIKLP